MARVAAVAQVWFLAQELLHAAGKAKKKKKKKKNLNGLNLGKMLMPEVLSFLYFVCEEIAHLSSPYPSKTNM